MTKVLTKVNDQYCKGLLFCLYEIKHEAIIKRLREERVELCARLLENLRLSQGDPERQMGYLRREQSQRWLGARYDHFNENNNKKNNTLQKLIIDDVKVNLN